MFPQGQEVDGILGEAAEDSGEFPHQSGSLHERCLGPIPTASLHVCMLVCKFHLYQSHYSGCPTTKAILLIVYYPCETFSPL